MGQRLTANQWAIIKKNFPASIEEAIIVKLDFDSRLFKINYRRNMSKLRKSSMVNDTMLEILEWCKDMLTGDFYVEASKSDNEFDLRTGVFYFADAGDAAIFKLTWMNSKGIVDND